MITSYEHPDVESALALFRDHVRSRDEAADRVREAEREVIANKSEQLMPLRMLLFKLQSMDVMVQNTAVTAQQKDGAPPQPIHVIERASSETWAPGVSLMLDHPATIEIAIPNLKDIGSKGVVVIHLATNHPDAALFSRPFKQMGEAVKALAKFIAQNTVRVGRMPATDETFKNIDLKKTSAIDLGKD